MNRPPVRSPYAAAADLSEQVTDAGQSARADADRIGIDRSTAAAVRGAMSASGDRSGPGYVAGISAAERAAAQAAERYGAAPPPVSMSQVPAASAPRRTMSAATRAAHAAGLDRSRQPADDAQLQALGLKKTFTKGPAEIPVLRGVNLAVRCGEFLAIVGQSGSGKSTLLHLLATLDAPDAGEIHFDGRRIDNLAGRARDQIRNRSLGMIFQFYHLLPELTALENVLAPIMIRHGVLGYLARRRHYRRRAEELLELVGLAHRVKHRPKELSGGEMQRAAIARALICEPELLLADEPTGNLDQTTGRDILEILHGLNRRQNLTIVMVTHDPAIAQRADRVVRMIDGRLDAQLP